MFDGRLDIVIPLSGFAFFLVLGWLVGRWNERKHLASLAEREQEMAGMLVTDLKAMPGADPAGVAVLVIGEAVIATDYLKVVQARIRNLLGGQMRSYEVLMQRARREAILRMLEDARRRGYNAVCNVRMETSDIGGSASGGTSGSTMVEAMAFGTAYLARTGRS